MDLPCEVRRALWIGSGTKNVNYARLIVWFMGFGKEGAREATKWLGWNHVQSELNRELKRLIQNGIKRLGNSMNVFPSITKMSRTLIRKELVVQDEIEPRKDKWIRRDIINNSNCKLLMYAFFHLS